jgi:hypothetical protein
MPSEKMVPIPYLNYEMEVLCNVVREQVLGKTDFEVFPREIAQQWRTNRPHHPMSAASGAVPLGVNQ